MYRFGRKMNEICHSTGGIQTPQHALFLSCEHSAQRAATVLNLANAKSVDITLMSMYFGVCALYFFLRKIVTRLKAVVAFVISLAIADVFIATLSHLGFGILLDLIVTVFRLFRLLFGVWSSNVRTAKNEMMFCRSPSNTSQIFVKFSH